MRILVNKCRRNYRTRNFLGNPMAVIVSQKNHWWLLKSVSKNTVRNRIPTGSQSFPQVVIHDNGGEGSFTMEKPGSCFGQGTNVNAFREGPNWAS